MNRGTQLARKENFMKAVMVSEQGERFELMQKGGKLYAGDHTITEADLKTYRIITDSQVEVCNILGLSSDDSRVMAPPDQSKTYIGGELA
jgi:hypothetical protein